MENSNDTRRRQTATSRRSDNQRKRTSKKGKKKKGGWFYNHPIAVLCASLAAITLLALWLLFGFSGYHGEEQWIYIPPQATNQSVRDSLKSHLGMLAGNRTYMLWRLQKGSLQRARGMYRVEPGTRALQLSRRLKAGRQTPIKISFQGVRTLDRMAANIASQLEFTDSAFIQACDSILPAAGFKKAEFPAAFIPDTYEVYITDNAATIVNRLLRERNRFWNDQRLAKATAEGLTPVGVATIASIVEEESAKADERPNIARLYMNRLQKHMRLQADPTVKFGLKEFGLRRILNKHVQTPTPYNTYLIDGLPPGPIRVANRATLEAVLNAPKHPYIYMCAKEDFSGYHNFAKTYDEHMANARRYQAELNRRNIH